MATAKQLAALKKGREAMAKLRADVKAAGAKVTRKKHTRPNRKKSAKKTVVAKVVKTNPVRKRATATHKIIKVTVNGKHAYLISMPNKFDTIKDRASVLTSGVAKEYIAELRRRHPEATFSQHAAPKKLLAGK